MTLRIPRSGSPGPSRERSERGVALISVLWALVVLSLIAAAFTRSTRTDIAIAVNLGTLYQVMELADSGVFVAVQGLIAKSARQTWRTDGAVYAWTYAGSEIRVSIHDESGKVDLNAASVELLTRLLRAAELDEAQSVALAEAMADFRDTDDLARSSDTEDAGYRSAGMLLGPKNGPFASIAELRQIPGIANPLFDRIAPALTVYSRLQQPFGANIAPSLKAALAGDTLEPAGSIRAPNSQQTNTSPTLSDFATDAQLNSRSPVGVYTIRSEVVRDDGTSFAREAVVRVSGARGRPFEFLEWRPARHLLFAIP